MVPVFKGAPFYEVNALVGEKGVDWDCVVQMAGKCASRILVSDGVEIPQGKYVGTFKSDALYKLMMQNTFERILMNNKTKKKPVDICVKDVKGKSVDFTLKLSDYASKMVVVTQNKSDYVNLCDKMQKINGLCPSIVSDIVQTEIYIDADECVMKINGNEECMKICGGEEFSVPEIYGKLLPKDINKYDFYSALYELCGVFAINQCSFDTVLVNNEKRCVADVHFS